MSHDEYDPGEPVPGLPEVLPQGETMIWQGSPDAITMARRGFHGNLVAAYFAILAASSSISAYLDGAAPANALLAGSHFIVIGAIAFSIVALLGYLVHRTTLYTITSKRLVMRFGVALPMTLNIPFKQIASADAKVFANATGNIAFTPATDLPVTYVHMWPHARGLYLARPQPTMRCVADAKGVCDLLTKAMLAHGVVGETKPLKVKSASQAPASSPSGIPAAA